MKFSEAWLREWVNPGLDSAELAHQLTMLGLEVDGVHSLGAGLDKVVVGEVLAVDPHPNADRLRVCKVSVGDGEPLNIVCGAPNVRAGSRYPAALVGAQMPGGPKIRRSKIRGEVSEGMLCSEVELGVGDDASGIMELPAAMETGQSVVSALSLDDSIIDVDLTPNRADCFCLMGIARDLGAAHGLSVSEPDTTPIEPTSEVAFPVDVDAQAGCGRFAGRVIENIDPDAVTPGWMQQRLERSGVRPIHPVVDVTNYVMLELGQPLHGYDLARLEGRICVRRGHSGEKLVLLDGQSVDVDGRVMVIADNSGPIGLAGIMGGESTAVSAATRNVYLEAAFFNPDAMAGVARSFGLHTDASVRFERGVDPEQQARAIERATRLLLDIAGGTPGPTMTEVSPGWLPDRSAVTLRRARVTALLGLEIADDRIEQYLVRQKMIVTPVDGGWQVQAPSSRFDIGIEADLIEEIARLHGYDEFPEIAGNMTVDLGAATEARVPITRVREALVARGYSEAITYSFIDPDVDRLFAPSPCELPLSNPISSEMAVMRSSLWPGLVAALRYNQTRQQERLLLFESGVRFIRQDTDIIEEEMIAGIAAGSRLPEQWGASDTAVDLFDRKADISALTAMTGADEEFEYQAASHPALRPGRTAEILRSGKHLGWLGEMHPALIKSMDLTSSPVLFEIGLEAFSEGRKSKYHGISKYPVVRRDLAFIVDDETPVAEIVGVVRKIGGTVLRDTIVFDIYAGKNVETGSKSVALGLILQDRSRTLTDTDVDKIMHSVVERLSRDFNATIRE